MKRSIFFCAFFPFLLLQLNGAFAQSNIPADQEIIEAIFPWCISLDLEQNFRVCTGEKYQVYLSGGPVQASFLKDTSQGQLFAAAIAFGQGEDLEHYYWYNQVLLALILKRHSGKLELIQKKKLPNEGEYMHRVYSVKSRKVNGIPSILLEYRYSDSVSSPRGWHKICKIFTISRNNRAKEIWSFETEFIRAAAGSLPRVEKSVDFHFVDLDADGDEDIITNGSVIRSNLWSKYSWDQGKLIKSQSNE